MPESLSEPRPLTQAAIFRCLEQGAHLITANLRLSRFFQQRFASHAAATGRPVWLAPLILPQKDWLLQLRERLLITGQLAARTVLNPEQERLLWEEIIRNSPEGENLLRPRATARQVAEAWTLLHDWQLDFPAAVSDGNEDTEAFANWCRAFRRRCAQADWISMAEIPASLSAALAEAGSAANPLAGQTLLLAGFDELVPAARTLFERLAASGSEVRWLLPEAVAEAGTRGLVECADEHEEIRLMARWARQQVETRPGGTVAVVVPDLSARREAIVTALSALLPGEGNSALFNVSLGLPLNRYSLVQTAFDLLSLLPRRRLEPATASALLLSPFVAGWEAESRSRALLDRRLRETGEVRISLRRLIRLASQVDRPWHCPQLAAHLQALESRIGELPERETAAGWMQLFSRCLGAAGWPAGRSLDSREYQCFEAWQKALSGFAQLQEVAGQFDLRRALAGLRQLVGERIFQPESKPAPVQVLGLYEAAGQQFDALWLMGMSDNAWPAPARPNPFLPLSLQRRHDLPHASAARELAVARRLGRRLLASAATVIVSYAASGASAEQRGPSPLFHDWPRRQPPLWTGEDWLTGIRLAADCECLREDPAPALGRDEVVGGGSRIFRLQSNCPFRAFAELRLGAQPLARADIGLDALARGSLVHRVLELVWDTLESQDCLLQLAPEALAELVADMVRLALREQPRALAEPLPGYRELEARRLQQRVLDWLELERQRPPFRVRQTEQLQELRIAGVPIRLKLDRVDELADGSRLLIDYKTGAVSASQWFGERPEDPQLPLYASVSGGELAAVAFACLQARETGFRGVAREADLLPGVKDFSRLAAAREFASWEELLDHWKTTVERLAAAFRDGEAAVDPLGEGEACRYCELSTLCRIHEQPLESPS